MRVTFPRNGHCSEVEIPRGEYQVVLNSESNQISLIGGGIDLKLPATRRRAKSRFKTVNVTFYCGGGKFWSLIISTPKHGEWISMIELND